MYCNITQRRNENWIMTNIPAVDPPGLLQPLNMYQCLIIIPLSPADAGFVEKCPERMTHQHFENCPRYYSYLPRMILPTKRVHIHTSQNLMDPLNFFFILECLVSFLATKYLISRNTAYRMVIISISWDADKRHGYIVCIVPVALLRHNLV